MTEVRNVAVDEHLVHYLLDLHDRVSAATTARRYRSLQQFSNGSPKRVRRSGLRWSE
jgi:hypothetical protein